MAGNAMRYIPVTIEPCQTWSEEFGRYVRGTRMTCTESGKCVERPGPCRTTAACLFFMARLKEECGYGVDTWFTHALAPNKPQLTADGREAPPTTSQPPQQRFQTGRPGLDKHLSEYYRGQHLSDAQVASLRDTWDAAQKDLKREITEALQSGLGATQSRKPEPY